MPPSMRFPEIDLLRTVAIVLMIIYHLAFDLSVLYGWDIDLKSPGWTAVQQASAGLFLLMVGVSFAVSWQRQLSNGRSFLQAMAHTCRRALRIATFAVIISIVTFIATSQEFIRFGILHLIALALILLPLLSSLREWNAAIGILCLLIGPWMHTLHSQAPFLLPIGITPHAFSTLDYFPLFPWFGVVLIGYALGYALYVRFPQWHTPAYDRCARMLKPLTIPGRFSLTLYLAHQPLLIAILWILIGRPAHAL